MADAPHPMEPSPPSESRGDADALQRRLTDRALQIRVEGRGGVALLIPIAGVPAELDHPTRRWLVQQGREAGFANIALEIPEAAAPRAPADEPSPQPPPKGTPERDPEPTPQRAPEPTPEPTTPAPIPQRFPGPETDTVPDDAALPRREPPR